jgi:hypothetical protein
MAQGAMYILATAICSIGKIKAMHSSIAMVDESWMHSFDPQLK